MKLRLILLVLSLLAFLSASTGGYLYYSSLKESAQKESESQTSTRAEMIRKNLSFFLSENIKPVKTMAGMLELQAPLINSNDESLAKANALLDHYKTTLDEDVCYLMDPLGNTIASSNRNDDDSFVEKIFPLDHTLSGLSMVRHPLTWLWVQHPANEGLTIVIRFMKKGTALQ